MCIISNALLRTVMEYHIYCSFILLVFNLTAETKKATTPENAMGLPSVVPSAETAASEAERHERETLSDMFSPSSPHDFEPIDQTINRAAADTVKGSGAPDGGILYEKATGEKLNDDKGRQFFLVIPVISITISSLGLRMKIRSREIKLFFHTDYKITDIFLYGVDLNCHVFT